VLKLTVWDEEGAGEFLLARCGGGSGRAVTEASGRTCACVGDSWPAGSWRGRRGVGWRRTETDCVRLRSTRIESRSGSLGFAGWCAAVTAEKRRGRGAEGDALGF
jgi:hypothetical protein